MRSQLFRSVLGLALLSACSPDEQVRAADSESTQPAGPSFVSSTVCSDCHTRLYEPGVEPNWSEMSIVHHDEQVGAIDPDAIGPYSLWSGTMMAHAAQDPYWRAKVRFESRTTPSASAEIENACLSCHAPAQQYGYRFEERAMRLDDLAGLGLEGVTCTSCHQISPDKLGTKESFTAGFVINRADRIYGPHADPFPMPMRMHTGKTPTESAHILESALCGSCHTVITPTLDEQGRQVGEFVEQGTYLEWLTSDFPSEGKTCQSCHMPPLTDETGEAAEQYIAHTPHGGYFGPTSPRKPFGRHSFQGANAPMLDLLAELFPAKKDILTRSAERARATLRSALSMTVSGEADADTLTARVKLVNESGHKLPSGFPSRRLWLHLSVEDGQGATVFESGAFNSDTGELTAGEAGPAPHRDVIADPSRTMVYEAEMGDADGRNTVSLMRAARFVKDNRLLPRGFGAGAGLPDGVSADSIAPRGVGDDPNFGPGGDQVAYRVDVQGRSGPFTVAVEALYQTFKPSHTRAFEAHGSQDEARFLELVQGRRSPVEVARARIEIGR